MNKLLSIAALAVASISAPAIADDHGDMDHDDAAPMAVNSFQNLAYTFKAADLDGDGMLSDVEYEWYRMHSWDSKATTRGNNKVAITNDYAMLDSDKDGTVSRGEFMNVANNDDLTDVQKQQMMQAVYAPDYYTLTYYLTATPISADYFDGREVINMKGDEIGKITEIVRTKENGTYYAMIDLDGSDMYRPTAPRRDKIGINLDELVLSMSDKSVAMIEKGENRLRTMDVPVIGEYDDVEYIFTIS